MLVMKDRRLDILCVNESKVRKSTGEAMSSNADTSRHIGLVLTRANEDAAVLASYYQNAYLILDNAPNPGYVLDSYPSLTLEFDPAARFNFGLGPDLVSVSCVTFNHIDQ
ncbi:hypothetical protein EVAR_66597_1 [Eumeta japonica]|uniref:Uncharacterized protein n=1 Tax=Eumeta variegata TaxID=151549 RepID=A0A4C1ZQQ8_EUMVA|nr:hypothetical protein EVAR_66597_1 [Eumeta japonica]